MIRPYVPADREAIIELHQKYQPETVFPDPDNEQNFACWIDEVDGVIRGTVILRTTCELIGIGNRGHGTPGERLAMIAGLMSAAAATAFHCGMHEAHAPVQPAEHRYGDRLVAMGLYKDNRQWYTLDCKQAVDKAKEKKK